MEGHQFRPTPSRESRVWREPQFILLALLVAAIYFSRLTTLPMVGEEARWARGAAEMLETGDWIVLRQQGQVFPERPPMTCWSMAVAGLAWGDLDKVAVRLPSVTAVLLTSLLLYIYLRTFTSATGAMVGGLAYATFGQVLQIGRHGESEALFTLFLGGAMLVWHMGYARGWTRATTWTLAYGMAACAALCKGPQGPIYFVAATWFYLLLQRDWKWLVSRGHAIGLAGFAAIIMAWQIPYFLATDLGAVHDTWAGLAKDRFAAPGFLEHLATYPIEIFVCLLPWSPLALMLTSRRFRDGLGDLRVPLVFLVTAIAITFPSVWLAPIARGRYFMPLYPCFAALIAIVVERCATLASDEAARRIWRGFAWLGGALASIVALGAVVVLAFPNQSATLEALSPFVLITVATLATIAAAAHVWAARDANLKRTACSTLAFAALIGLLYTGPAMSIFAAKWHDPEPDIEHVRSLIPAPDRIVSLGPVNARFAFHYRSFIPELAWPRDSADLPADVEYFFMMQYASDPPDVHSVGRGRSWTEVPAALPFEWEEVARIPCARRLTTNPEHMLVLARVRREEAVASRPDTTGDHGSVAR